MNLNLARSWNDTCSPPQTPFLAFFSRQSEAMMFSAQKTIEIICQAGLSSVALTWSLHRNMIEKPFLSGKAEPMMANNFRIKINSKALIPGFYDLRVTLDTGLVNKKRDKLSKRPVTGVCTFGWQAERMAIRDTRPKDFRKFWTQAKKEIDAVPLKAKNETEMQTFKGMGIDEYNLKYANLPPDYDPNGHKTDEVESCKVSFAGPDGGRIYGWLAKPKGKGPFPIMLVLPGAGFAPRPRPLEHARHGYLALDLQIHGQDVDLPEPYPTVPGYHDQQVFKPINHYYYYNIHKRVRQAVNYLVSRKDTDTGKVVAVGGSQGGRLAIVIAGLDQRITDIVSAIANSPNRPHLSWVNSCNEQKQDAMDLRDAPPALDTDSDTCFAYYDPMNYTPDIKCRVLMNGGLVDPVSPAYSVWAVYNRLTCKTKQIIPIAGHGHDWSAEFDRYAWKWLEETK